MANKPDSNLKILVVDDDPNTRYMIEVFSKGEPYELVTVGNGKEAIERIQKGDINIVVTDIRMPEIGGEAVLNAVRTFNPAIPVIIMTSFGTIEDAVHFLKSGAHDYLTKPLTKDAFCHKMNLTMDFAKMSQEISQLKTSLKRYTGSKEVIGNSQAMRRVMEKLTAIAQTDAAVVIYGESGTGKELIARTIHYSSRRADLPFVTVNCGALPETLLESELFGYKRGAFTDAHADYSGLVVEANTGTLFLDEVGEVSPRVQVKLLRFLQEKEIKPLGSTKTIRTDVRIISATNKDLQVAIEKGTFREDLYYRLNVVPILLPPLRDRKEDVPILANYFLKKFAKEFDKDVHEFSRMGMQKLVGYHWPGNVRELENKIQQTMVMTNSSIVGPEHIDLPGVFDTFRQEKQKLLAEFEYNYVTKLLSLHHGNISRAAKAAGMDRKNFWQLISKHKITPKSYAVDPNAEAEIAVKKPHTGKS